MIDAFSDYSLPMRPSQQEFDAMMLQRGLDAASSRVAWAGQKIAGIWLTSVRGSEAYLIASGTRPAFRSRGVARAMAEDCMAYLKAAGVRSFGTEVLRGNTSAASLYTSLGMEKRRVLDCYSIAAADPPADGGHAFRRVHWDEISPNARALRAWAPSWQNSDHSLAAIADQLLCFSRMDGSDLTAYAAVGSGTGIIHQIAVRNDARRNGVATSLLRAIQNELPGIPLRLINICQSDAAFRAFMKQAGARETAGQFELKMTIRK